jgi:BirA family biotin operon repressor/biotin-[acetyl-CoA-carboxylase] ligase
LPISLHFVAQTGSTNADLSARLAGGERISEGYWLIADRQVKGRGRQGRSWLDAPGNFMGSTVVTLGLQDPPAASLSFVTSLAVYESLAARLADPRLLQVKWPNDVLLAGEKVCGILLERQGDTAVVGIGVNLAAAPVLEGRSARSVSQHGPAPDRDAFAANLASIFERELGRWRQYGLEIILKRWGAVAHPPGSRLAVHDGKGQRLSGRFDGLGPDGALRLRLEDGGTRVIHAGDVMLEED